MNDAIYHDDDDWILMVKNVFNYIYLCMDECSESDYNLDIIVLIFCIFVCTNNLVCMFKW